MVLAWALAVFLSVWNNTVNLVPVFARAYVPINLALTATLLAIARASGLTWEDLGLAHAELADGLRWGGAAALAVALFFGVLLGVPRLRPLLRDGRIADMEGATLARYALLSIPFGTVVLEEVAFRGVLLGAWLRISPAWVAVAVSCVVFGIWHVVPTLVALKVNPQLRSKAAALVISLLVTAVGGVAFCLLRLGSGSLLAPVLAHLATNVFGAYVASLAWRAHTAEPAQR